jgi:hypothetical protein
MSILSYHRLEFTIKENRTHLPHPEYGIIGAYQPGTSRHLAHFCGEISRPNLIII